MEDDIRREPGHRVRERRSIGDVGGLELGTSREGAPSRLPRKKLS